METAIPKAGLTAVSMDNTRVTRVFPLEKREQDVDSTCAGAYMPVGSEVASLVQMERGGIGLIALAPVTQARVWHPMRVMPMDVPITMLIGKTFGPILGVMPARGAPVVLIAEFPWPTANDIESMTTAGNG